MTTATLDTTTRSVDAGAPRLSIKGAVRAVLIAFPVLYMLHCSRSTSPSASSSR